MKTILTEKVVLSGSGSMHYAFVVPSSVTSTVNILCMLFTSSVMECINCNYDVHDH